MPKRILIVGAGLTGLCAAHRIMELSKKNNLDIQLQILEAGDRSGGVITTEDWEECTLELGPDSFITTKPWALELAQRLGLSDRLIGTDDKNRRSFVLRNKTLIPLPEGFYMLAPGSFTSFFKTPLFTKWGKARMLLDLVIPGKKNIKDESLASFVRRRLGEEAFERAAQPMVGGVYTADPETLSVRATMPQFLEMEERLGSVIRGIHAAQKANKKEKGDSGARYSMFLSFKSGMRELLDALVMKLPKGSVKYNTKVEEVIREDKTYVVKTKDSMEKADGVIITTPSYIAQELVKNIDPVLSMNLGDIEFASSAIQVSVYKKEDIENNLDGFGFVVPATENNPLLACSYLSKKFPSRAPKGQVILRSFVGGALDPGILEKSDEELTEIIDKELGAILGIKGKPVYSKLKRYPRAMPQYKIGHLEIVKWIESSLSMIPGLEVAGIAYRGVGIPDCVRSGELAAQRLIDSLFSDNSI